MTESENQRREIIRQILSLEQTGQVLSDESVRALEPELYEKACQLFGTWPVALEYAGVRLVVTVLQHHIGSAMGCASQPGASPSIALL